MVGLLFNCSYYSYQSLVVCLLSCMFVCNFLCLVVGQLLHNLYLIQVVNTNGHINALQYVIQQSKAKSILIPKSPYNQITFN